MICDHCGARITDDEALARECAKHSAAVFSKVGRAARGSMQAQFLRESIVIGAETVRIGDWIVPRMAIDPLLEALEDGEIDAGGVSEPLLELARACLEDGEPISCASVAECVAYDGWPVLVRGDHPTGARSDEIVALANDALRDGLIAVAELRDYHLQVVPMRLGECCAHGARS